MTQESQLRSVTGWLTLSTCDYQEKNGRFVVVAKDDDKGVKDD